MVHIIKSLGHIGRSALTLGVYWSVQALVANSDRPESGVSKLVGLCLDMAIYVDGEIGGPAVVSPSSSSMPGISWRTSSSGRYG